MVETNLKCCTFCKNKNESLVNVYTKLLAGTLCQIGFHVRLMEHKVSIESTFRKLICKDRFHTYVTLIVLG